MLKAFNNTGDEYDIKEDYSVGPTRRIWRWSPS